MTGGASQPVSGFAGFAVINPSGQRTRVALHRSPFLFGRQPGNHLVLRDNRISRTQARVTADDGEHFLEDLNSRHGTYVNGERIQGRHRLLNSDTVTFGFPDSYQLVFLREDRELSRLADQVTMAQPVTGTGALAKLRTLVEVARTLQSSLSVREILEAVVDASLALTRTGRGFLLLKHGEELSVEVARDASGSPLSPADLHIPTRVIQRALNARSDLLSMHFDPGVEGAEEADRTIQRLDLRSIVCIPLVRVRMDSPEQTVAVPASNTTGLIYLDSRTGLADLSLGNREILQTLALEASAVLENARLLEQERARRRLDEELRIAREIQQSLLPRTLPSQGWFRVAASALPSQQVGGDYYDVVQLAAGAWSVIVADVSGKGVSSALLASLLQGAFLHRPAGPAAMRFHLEHLNRYLHQRTEGEKYATLFYAVIERSGEMHYANAAHCEPLLRHASGEVEKLETTSLPVGLLDGVEFPVRSLRLEPGDRMVVYSDGFSDAQNERGETFDVSRILEVLEMEPAHSPALNIHSALTAAVRNFTGAVPQRDDMTLLIAEYLPEAEPSS